jgi:hypothetical protein
MQAIIEEKMRRIKKAKKKIGQRVTRMETLGLEALIKVSQGKEHTTQKLLAFQKIR